MGRDLTLLFVSFASSGPRGPDYGPIFVGHVSTTIRDKFLTSKCDFSLTGLRPAALYSKRKSEVPDPGTQT